VIAVALSRTKLRIADPVERLAALGSADLAAGVGFLIRAARAGMPILLDGLVSLAELAVAEDLERGVVAWCLAAHRSPEPAQQLALDKLGLSPLLDLGLRLGEGSGALAAVPLLRSSALLMRETALLADLASP
jgi:nicotinate-nucleotide--dimethylbenzimidazole phosphoribosyltransferase